MIVITDSNIIFSALISPNGVVAKIFKEKSNIQFIAPTYMLEEVYNHWVKLNKHSSLDTFKLIKELDFLKSKISFIVTVDIPRKFRLQAYEIVKDFDSDDAVFVALNLYKKHKIWTSDKVLINGLEKKGYKICVTTAELKAKLYKK